VSLSPVSSAGSTDISPADETSAAATADTTAIGSGSGSPHDEPTSADQPSPVTGPTEDLPGEAKDRRPTAFVVDLDGDDSSACDTSRRLPPDPLSRYVPPRVERSSAKRRAEIVRRKLRHREVVMGAGHFGHKTLRHHKIGAEV